MGKKISVIDKSNYVLVYVIKIGFDHKGRALYEFVFNDTTQDVFGDEWEKVPASGSPQPPQDEYIKLVGTLKSEEVYMDVIQESDVFGVCDAVDGVIALAWEVDKLGDGVPDDRLVFRFGDTKTKVEEILYKRDIILKYEE